jgi:hypothetical protein
LAADHVVQHLVPIHDPQRVSARVAVDFNAEDEVFVAEVARVARGDQPGIREGGDAVFFDAAPGDLFDADAQGHAGVEELAEGGINGGAEERGFPFQKLRRQLDLRLTRQPLAPGDPVVAEILAGQPGEQPVELECVVEAGKAHQFDQARDGARIAAAFEFAIGGFALLVVALGKLTEDIHQRRLRERGRLLQTLTSVGMSRPNDATQDQECGQRAFKCSQHYRSFGIRSRVEKAERLQPLRLISQYFRHAFNPIRQSEWI